MKRSKAGPKPSNGFADNSRVAVKVVIVNLLKFWMFLRFEDLEQLETDVGCPVDDM